MSEWSAGYVSELGYTYGYYEELNPNRIDFCLANKGYKAPKIKRALELGFGQGVSINIHAAASSITWVGTDFNPAQANFASTLAVDSGANVGLLDDSFEQLLARDDISDFDYIGLHGIWSWVSDYNREIITEIIKQKLNVGGVVYASYNTLPGWAGFAPLRHLMSNHAEIMGSSGHSIINKIDDALAFSEALLKVNPSYTKTYPQIQQRLEALRTQDRHYLAHEFFNRDWQPMFFADINKIFSEAKLTFVASADLGDHIDQIHLSADQQQLINDVPDFTMKETLRDFIVNRQFRKDYWVKGPMKLNPKERLDRLRDQDVVMIVPRSAAKTEKVKVSGKEVDLNHEVYAPILDLMSDHKPRKIAEIEQKLRPNNDNAGVAGTPSVKAILQAMAALVGANYLRAAQDVECRNNAKLSARKINEVFLKATQSSNDIQYMASPVTGGGIPADRIDQLFIKSLLLGKETAKEWADEAWELLASEGRRLVKEGVKLETEEENKTELFMRAEEFSKIRLPVLKALEII